MFLHLITDEKFIDGAIERFQRNDPGNHRFIFITRQATTEPFKYIKKREQVSVIRLGTAEYEELLTEAECCTAVFIHNLIDINNVEFVNRSSGNTIFVWLYWGADVWALKEFRKPSLLPSTNILFLKNKWQGWLSSNHEKYKKLFCERGALQTINIAVKGFHEIGKQAPTTRSQKDVKKAMMRADYIIPVIKDDYVLLKKMIGCRGQLLDWNYTPGIDFESPVLSPTGSNILVGNSAHYANNHLEIFKKLKNLKLEFEKVIVPLSYGDPVYRGSILTVGEKIFGKHFWGVQEYLPIHRYTEIISSCSMAFFNSVRQQATGNVLLMIFLGARVFLREENPVLNYLLRNGVQVFSIQKHLRKNDSSLYAPLSNDVIQKNRTIIKRMFGEEGLDQKTKTLVSFLRAKKQP